MAYVLASPTLSSQSVRSTNNVRCCNHDLQPCNWFAGRRWSISYLISPSLVPSHLTPVNSLFLTHVWSNRDSGIIDSDDLLALAAAVHMYIKLRVSPQQRYPHRLPELLTAFTALLVRRQPDDVPVLHNASAMQRQYTQNSGYCKSWAMN